MTDVFLPLLFKVRHSVLTSGGTSDLGSPKDAWESPEERDVYGWGPPQLQPVKEVIIGSTRYVVAVELMVPPEYTAKDGDRIQLGDNDDYYRVIGPIEDYAHNPFGWNPGSVVNLLYVKGGP